MKTVALCLLLTVLLALAGSLTAQKTVVVLGGGVGGLSATHELIERGFKVKVYDRQSVFGGKARSIPVTGSGKGGRGDLPGEHGFRFFPGVYVNLVDTMKRIDWNENTKVADNLIGADFEMLARTGGNPWIFPTHKPTNTSSLIEALKSILHFKELGIPLSESVYFAERVALMAGTCDARWDTEYDKYSYWEFMHGADLSENYGKYLVIGLTRNIVAAKADVASLKTIGRTFIRLVASAAQNNLDRLLNGPTNEQWLTPWTNFLKNKGVEMHNDAMVIGLDFDGTQITGAKVQHKDGSIETVTGDIYVSGVPLERMIPLLTPEIEKAAPSLSHLREHQVQWMNGIQFYLKKKVDIVRGHVGYFDSPWALTSLTQQQFWPKNNVSKLGDGTAVDILSVDVSDWNKPGFADCPSKGLIAKECTKQQIVDEVWCQLQKHLPNILPKNMSDIVSSWFMDPDIVFDDDSGKRVNKNEEPLLINLAGSWDKRPKAYTEIPNLFLASEYVQTTFDVASMESANEAARRAVNAILKSEGKPQDVNIFDYIWLGHFSLEKQIDCARFAKGLKPIGWDFPLPKSKKRTLAMEAQMEEEMEAQYMLKHWEKYQNEMLQAKRELIKSISKNE